MISFDSYGPLLAVGCERFLMSDLPTAQIPTTIWKHTFPNKAATWILNFLFKEVDHARCGVPFLFSRRSLDIFRFRPFCGDVHFLNLNEKLAGQWDP